eukprot:c19606_g1_i2.p1 GENE.c19606_g1_i2~~c19606_g1_i2.p1  ORF type:complete len:113 (-),score=20.16 c19606_g1_i2:241-579(-)
MEVTNDPSVDVPEEEEHAILCEPLEKPAQNPLLQLLSSYHDRLGYSSSELQMIVKDLLTCPKVQAVADPTSHLQEIISESALVAFDMYNDLEAKSDEALGTGTTTLTHLKHI